MENKHNVNPNEPISINRVGYAFENLSPSGEKYYRISLDPLKVEQFATVKESKGIDGKGEFINLSIRTMAEPQKYGTHQVSDSIYHAHGKEDKYAIINLNLDYKKLKVVQDKDGYINITASLKKSNENKEHKTFSNAEYKVFITKPKGEEVTIQDYLGHGSAISHNLSINRPKSNERTRLEMVGTGFVDQATSLVNGEVVNASVNKPKLIDYLDKYSADKVFVSFMPKENKPNEFVAYISHNKNDQNAVFTFKLKGDEVRKLVADVDGYTKISGYYKDLEKAAANKLNNDNFNINVVPYLSKKAKTELPEGYKSPSIGEGADREFMKKWQKIEKSDASKTTNLPSGSSLEKPAKGVVKSSSKASDKTSKTDKESKMGGLKVPTLDNTAKPVKKSGKDQKI